MSHDHDPVTNPSHYVDRVPGIECREVAGHFPYFIGNAIKYLWRAGLKGDEVEDLRKAIQSIEFHIGQLEQERTADELAELSESVPFVGVEQVRPAWTPPVRPSTVTIGDVSIGELPVGQIYNDVPGWVPVVHNPDGTSHVAGADLPPVNRWYE